MSNSREAYIRYVTRKMERNHYPAYVIRRVIKAIKDGEAYREEWQYDKWFPYYRYPDRYDEDLLRRLGG